MINRWKVKLRETEVYSRRIIELSSCVGTWSMSDVMSPEDKILNLGARSV